MRTVYLAFFAIILFNSIQAQNIKIVTKDGQETEMNYIKHRVKNNGIEVKRGLFINYQKMSYVGTDNIDAYERLMRKAGTKENEHLNIDFTGDGSAYAARLKKLQENSFNNCKL